MLPPGTSGPARPLLDPHSQVSVAVAHAVDAAEQGEQGEDGRQRRDGGDEVAERGRAGTLEAQRPVVAH